MFYGRLVAVFACLLVLGEMLDISCANLGPGECVTAATAPQLLQAIDDAVDQGDSAVSICLDSIDTKCASP